MLFRKEFSLNLLGFLSDAEALFRWAIGFGLMSDWLGCLFSSEGVFNSDRME